jgi:hypothetical protein
VYFQGGTSNAIESLDVCQKKVRYRTWAAVACHNPTVPRSIPDARLSVVWWLGLCSRVIGPWRAAMVQRALGQHEALDGRGENAEKPLSLAPVCRCAGGRLACILWSGGVWRRTRDSVEFLVAVREFPTLLPFARFPHVKITRLLRLHESCQLSFGICSRLDSGEMGETRGLRFVLPVKGILFTALTDQSIRPSDSPSNTKGKDISRASYRKRSCGPYLYFHYLMQLHCGLHQIQMPTHLLSGRLRHHLLVVPSSPAELVRTRRRRPFASLPSRHAWKT